MMSRRFRNAAAQIMVEILHVRPSRKQPTAMLFAM